MYQFRAIYCIAALLSFALCAPAFSSSGSGSDTYKPSVFDEDHKFASDDDNTVNDGYIAPTFQKLSRLYWSLAMFDLGDNNAIDNYLLINECELFSKYYNNDFEMEDLRIATRQSIVKNMASFENKFEIMIPIGLDRYDTGKESFKIATDSHIVTAKRIEIRVNNEINTCGDKFTKDIPGYPKNFILSLSRPFTLTDFPVIPEVAQLYIEESQKKFERNPGKYRDISQYGRIAYLRLKVTMNQFRQYVYYANNPPLTEIFGTIDGYEIYADREKQLLLYKQVVSSEQKKIYRRKKAEEPQVTPAEDAPSGEATSPDDTVTQP